MMRALVLCVAVISSCATPSPPSTELFPSPWPSEGARSSDGAVDLSAFPDGTGAPLRRQTEAALAGARGFGVSSGIFFGLDAALDPESLPRVEESASEAASVFVAIAEGERLGDRAPVDARFVDDAGPFGGTDLLAVLPYPGIPLRADTLYAAVVTTRVRTAEGVALPPAQALDEETADRARALGLAADEIAAITVFRTGDPTRGLREAFAHARAHDLPQLGAPTLVEDHEDYCVYAATVGMPQFQVGQPPYLEDGGGWMRRDDGSLVRQRVETARVVLTIPRSPAEPDGYPAAVFIRAGGGGDRPLVDRGPRDASGRAEAGSGYARDLARAGYVGASVDGPLGGSRNRAAWDEQFVLYNMLNPVAMRDNLRQSALELALFAEVLERLDIDTSDCAGASARAQIRSGLVLVGHSNGATIAPLAAAVQPRYRALVLSGAGASWIRQALYKESPLPTGPIFSILFGYDLQRQTFEHDPMLSLVQWAGEPADPAVYGHLLADRHVLVFQGILDTYIPPAISNPLALALGLDRAGAPLDENLTDRRSLGADLALVGRGGVELPARANQAGLTRALSQLPADGIEDGHEVMFQQPAAHAMVACFLETLRDGAPVVAGPGGCRSE